MLLLLVLLTVFRAGAAEVRLPELKTSRGTFTNVIVASRTENDIYIRTERFVGNIRITEIEDDAALIALGLKAAPGKDGTETGAGRSGTNAIFSRIMGTNQPLEALMKSPLWAETEKLREIQWSWNLIGMIAGVFLALYLFTSFCMKLICVKAGHTPGALIWVPILQMLPMFKAAGMSGWWLLGIFVPILNLVAWIMWAFKITQARGKSVVVAIALLLPFLSFFAFLYLAFSKGPDVTLKFSTKD